MVIPVGWALAGAAAGLAVGSIVWAVGADGMVPGGLLGGALGGTTGWWVDRRKARPAPPWVLWVPVGLALPALAWLGVLLSVLQESMTPLLGLGGLAAAILIGAVRAHLRGRVSRALSRLEAGDPGARTLLAQAATGRGGGARTASYALAMDDLRRGELAAAAGRLSRVEREGGPSAGPAAAALALVRLLQDRPDAALAAVSRALATGGPGVQGQTDAVRVLHVWRTEGADSARALAERVIEPASPALLIALLSALRRQTGDPAGGDALLSAPIRDRIARARWGERVSELYSFCE